MEKVNISRLINYKTRMDGDHVIVRTPSGKVIEFAPLPSSGLKQRKLSLEFYSSLNIKKVLPGKIPLVFIYKNPTWSSNNLSSVNVSAAKIASDLDISIEEVSLAEKAAQIAFKKSKKILRQ